jgi:pyridoxine 5'-phosphate synthase PdxJ
MTDADPAEYNNPLRFSLRTRKIRTTEYPDWMEITAIAVEPGSGNIFVHWRDTSTDTDTQREDN